MFGFSGSWVFQWVEIFKFSKWNWINFDFCNVGAEISWFRGKSFEGVFILFGVGFHLDWYDQATRKRWKENDGKSFEEMIKDLNNEDS